jgi:hypothetical protein
MGEYINYYQCTIEMSSTMKFHKGTKKIFLRLSDQPLYSDPEKDHAYHNECDYYQHKIEILLFFPKVFFQRQKVV